MKEETWEVGHSGVLSFRSRKKKLDYPGCSFKFNTEHGGTLEVPMNIIWKNRIDHVVVSTDERCFYIPKLFPRAGYRLDGHLVNQFQFSQIIQGMLTIDPRKIEYDLVLLEMNKGIGYYFGNIPIVDHVETTRTTLECDESILSQGYINGWNAESRVTGYCDVERSHGTYTLRPLHRTFLELDQKVDLSNVRDKARRVYLFWCMLTHHPSAVLDVAFIDRKQGHVAQCRTRTKGDPQTTDAWFQSSILEYRWTEIQSHIYPLMDMWIRLDIDSPWMENLIRLIEHRDLPVDVRFFMAYTTLQGFGQELEIGRPLRPTKNTKKIEEKVRMWEDYQIFWENLLFGNNGTTEQIVHRWVRTRHHFAHRSAPMNEDILRSKKEYEIAYFQIMAVLKTMFLQKVGVPTEEWKMILGQWATRIRFSESALFRPPGLTWVYD